MFGQTTTRRFPQRLPEPLRRTLCRYRAALRRQATLTRLPQALLLAGAVMVAGCLFDRLVDVPGIWRLPLPVLTVASMLPALFRLGCAFWRTRQTMALAYDLDCAANDPREHLRAALAFSRPEAPDTFFTRTSLQAAVSRWRDHDPATLLDWRPARRRLALLLAAVALVAAAAALPGARPGLLARRFWNPLGNHMRPTATWFTFAWTPVAPWFTGDDLEITARLAGRGAVSGAPLFHIRHDDGATSVRAFEPSGEGTYRMAVRNLSRSFTWQVTLGPIRSERRRVTVMPRPAIEHVTVTYHYPRYARLAPQTETLTGRTIAALQGTRVQLTLRANVPLERLEGIHANERFRFRIDRDDPRTAVIHRLIGETHQMQIELLSTDGIAGTHEAPFTFRAIPDNPPSVSIVNDLAGRVFFLSDIIEIAYRAQDDLGLGALFLRAFDDGVRATPVIVDIGLSDYGTRHAESTFRIPIADLVRDETRSLRLSLQAQDSRGQEGLSPTVVIQLASDSFDRQLRHLLLSYSGDRSHQPESRGLDAPQAHALRMTELRTAATRATMLADMIDPAPAADAPETPLAAPVRKALAAAQPPLTYGTWWFSDYITAPLLPRFRPLGAEANLWSWLDIPVAPLQTDLEAALRAPSPQPALQALVKRIDEAATRQVALHARTLDDQNLVVRELAGYLAETSQRRIRAATTADWRDADFVAERRAMLRELRQRLAALPPEEAPADVALAVLDTAAATESAGDAFVAILPALDTLVERLRQSAATHALAWSAARTPRGLPHMSPDDDRDISVLASGLLLDADVMDGDERLLFARALRFLRLYTGKEAAHPDDTRFLDPAATAGIAFDTFQTVLRLRTHLEIFRIGVSNGHLPQGGPEAEATWLRIRDARLSLLAATPLAPSAIQPQLRAIAEQLAAFAAWLPTEDCDTIAFLENIRRQEIACEEASRTLAPTVRDALRDADALVARHTADLATALTRYREAVAREIVVYETTHTNTFNNLYALKVRLTGITIATLKSLDFARLATLQGVGGKADVTRLVRMFVALGSVSRYFDEHVESLFWVHLYGVHKRGLEDEMWRGKVSAYAKLLDLLDTVQLLAAPAAADAPAVITASDHLQIGFALRTEYETLAQTDALLEAGASGGESTAAAEATLYLARHLRGVRSGAVSGPPPDWHALPSLPDDVRELFELLDETPPADTPLRPYDELIDRLRSRLPARSTEAPPAAPLQQSFIFSIDWGAVQRARQQQQQRLASDRHTVQRRLFERPAGAPADCVLAWACGELEVHRRKVSLAVNRLELGAVATGSDAASVNLPDHIYRELRRAREGAMPELFRDQSFEYLNSILKKAKP